MHIGCIAAAAAAASSHQQMRAGTQREGRGRLPRKRAAIGVTALGLTFSLSTTQALAMSTTRFPSSSPQALPRPTPPSSAIPSTGFACTHISATHISGTMTAMRHHIPSRPLSQPTSARSAFTLLTWLHTWRAIRRSSIGRGVELLRCVPHLPSINPCRRCS